MGFRKSILYFLAVSMTAGAGLAGCSDGSPPKAESTVLPAAEWQADVTFPDWKKVRSSNTAANNRIGFFMYSGQGTLYLINQENCSGVQLYVNDRKVETEIPPEGECHRMDISPYTRNGMNTLQISGIAEGKLRVCIPYPEVIRGTAADAGLSGRSLELIDRIITADIDNGFSGAQLAVVKDGRLVYEKAWGNIRTYDEEGNPVRSDAVTPDTMYDLASNTKMYSVNYALQYLVTEGKLDLDTKITDILGPAFAEDTIRIDYEGCEPADPETQKKWKLELTVRDLLMHQGGFPPGPQYFNDRYDHASQYFDSDSGNVIYTGAGADEDTREETLKAIFKTPLMYEPGTKTIYSDVDYMVLCYCTEKITGMRLDTYLQKTFWEPLGLKHICYNPLENGFEKKDCAATELMGNSRAGRLHYTGIRTYTLQGEVHDPNAYYCMDGVSGHAGMFSNASDLAVLASVMLSGGYGEHRFFSKDVISQFTAPSGSKSPDYGLGWWLEGDHNWDTYFGSCSPPSAFGHQGFTGTLTMIDPENNMVIVFLTNKIHSPMQENDPTLGKYNGNSYTTASLGFVPEILEIGLKGDADHGIYPALISDMAADKARILEENGIADPDHPEMKAYNALCMAADNTK